MKQLRKRIIRLLEVSEITDLYYNKEKRKITVPGKDKEMESLLHKAFCNYS